MMYGRMSKMKAAKKGKMLIESVIVLKDKCRIVVDGAEYNIALDTAVKYKLSAGKPLENDEFFQILDESEEILCKNYLYKSIAKYLKTEKGYREKLYRIGFHKKAVEKAIESAKNYGYIDDEKFAEKFISAYKNKKGEHRIRAELRAKGVSSRIVDKLLSSYETNEGTLDTLCAKFLNKREKSLDTKQKLYRHLLSKGFGYDEVSKAVDKAFRGE